MTPVIGRKLIEKESFLGSCLDNAGGFFQTKRLEFCGNLFRFLLSGLFSSWAWIAFSMAETALDFPAGTAFRTFR
jgi:hypothetical protein